MDDLKACIREIPDFPKPGILFKDIAPVLGDAALLNRVVDELGLPVLYSMADFQDRRDLASSPFLQSLLVDHEGNITLNGKVKKGGKGKGGNNKGRGRRSKQTIDRSSKGDDGDDASESTGYTAKQLRASLRRYYKGEGCSQADIVDALGKGRGGVEVSQGAVSNWLNNKSVPAARYHKAIIRVAKAYLPDAN